MLRGVWTREELEHETRFPLGLQLPPVERGSVRPLFRRAPRAMLKDACPPGRWLGYFVEYDGALLLLLEVNAPDKSRPGTGWSLQVPTWSLATLRISWDDGVLLDHAIRAVLFAAAVDIPYGRVVAREQDWYDTGYVETLTDAGWALRNRCHNFLSPPEELWPCIGDTHRQLLRVAWRGLGTGTLEEALAAFANTRELAQRWEADRYPGLWTALRNLRYGLKRSWRAWSEPRIRRWRIYRHQRWEKHTERWLERCGTVEARDHLTAVRETRKERDGMS